VVTHLAEGNSCPSESRDLHGSGRPALGAHCGSRALQEFGECPSLCGLGEETPSLLLLLRRVERFVPLSGTPPRPASHYFRSRQSSAHSTRRQDSPAFAARDCRRLVAGQRLVPVADRNLIGRGRRLACAKLHSVQMGQTTQCDTDRPIEIGLSLTRRPSEPR
jgi:hypothetical protein